MSKIKIYGASWCSPCKETKELLDSLCLDYEFIDVDQNVNDKHIQSFTAIPVLEFFNDDGELIKTHVGAIGKTHLIKIIKNG